ncbi:MAG TPA: hypothetical protein DER40_03445 [Geobacter sp.]|nr:hypothetical protein [Geobacter sp.]
MNRMSDQKCGMNQIVVNCEIVVKKYRGEHVIAMIDKICCRSKHKNNAATYLQHRMQISQDLWQIKDMFRCSAIYYKIISIIKHLRYRPV